MDSKVTKVGSEKSVRVGGVCRFDSCKITVYFFFNDTATTEIYTLSLHDALPIYMRTLKKNSPTITTPFVEVMTVLGES